MLPHAEWEIDCDKPTGASPDRLDTPEYLAPVLPPAVTEHKTFEVATVKFADGLLNSTPSETPVARQRSQPEIVSAPPPAAKASLGTPPPVRRQAEVATSPSTRVVRQRSWRIVGVLALLGMAAGFGLTVLSSRNANHASTPSPSSPGLVISPTASSPRLSTNLDDAARAPAVDVAALPVVADEKERPDISEPKAPAKGTSAPLMSASRPQAKSPTTSPTPAKVGATSRTPGPTRLDPRELPGPTPDKSRPREPAPLGPARF
ncbi:MAG: hypothetical protein MUF54_11295 [Polyangiaceae bacterium]|jgi:hypothetical protein|nr:hypothetical protein [Polyangiaceae bacterium]